nr:hypothetical protein [Tanacetum cinerariifolium]
MFEAITIKTIFHKKLLINQECQDERSNPSKDRELDIGEKVRDLDIGGDLKLRLYGPLCGLLNGDGRNDGQDGQVGGQGSEVNDGADRIPDFSTIIVQQLQNLLPTIVAQVGDQGRGQGICRNPNGDAVNENIQGNVSRVCTYKEFLACNPKEYDDRGGAIVYARWIEKIELVQDMSGCMDNQKVKYTAGSFVGKGLKCNEMQKLETELWNYVMVGDSQVVYTDRFHELARLVPRLVTLKGKRIERYRNVRDDNKRTRTGNAFATTANPVTREYTGHFAKDCRDVHRNVNHINARNPTARHVTSVVVSTMSGMDWLSEHKAEIIFHKKVAKEKEQEEIVVVRDFPEIFLDDLSGLLPVREIEFWIELIPRAMPIANTMGTSVAGVFGGYTVNALISLEAMVCSLRASSFILRRSLDQNICSGVNCFCGVKVAK